MNLPTLFILGYIPNQPEIKTKTLTQTTVNDSIKTRTTVDIDDIRNSFISGMPSAKKSAWIPKTKNIAIILSNSIPDCLCNAAMRYCLLFTSFASGSRTTSISSGLIVVRATATTPSISMTTRRSRAPLTLRKTPS